MLPGAAVPSSRKEAVIPRTITPEHQEALQRGREAKLEARRQSRYERVITYREWNHRDAERWREYVLGDMTREQWRAASTADPMPDTPSDDDFKIVDGRKTDEKEAA